MYFTFVHCFLIFVDLTCFGFLAYERGGFEKVGVRAPKKDDSKFGGSFRSGGRSFQSDRYSDKDRDFLNFRSRGNVSSPPRKTSEPVKEVKPTEPAKEVSTEDADSNKPVLSLKEQLASRPKVKLDPSKPKVDPFAGAKPREIVLEKRGVPDKVSAQPSSEKTEEKDVVTDQNSVKGKERSRVNSQGNSRGDWRGNAKEKSKVQPRRAPKAKVVEEAKVPIKSQNAFDLLAELDNE